MSSSERTQGSGSPLIPLYTIRTWDAELECYTPQEGMTQPWCNITQWQLKRAMQELQTLGYSCHRRRCERGGYDDNDTFVLIERTDGLAEEIILDCPFRTNYEPPKPKRARAAVIPFQT